MTEEAILNIASEAIWTIITSAGPLLLVSLIIGLIVSIFQTITSIQEQTLTFIPKLLGIFIVMLLLGSYILNNIVTFMTNLWSSFGDYVL
jgi:flagellar biosynthetic protein FliQ